MGMSKKHGLYGIEVGAAKLGVITQQNVVTGTETSGEPTSGEVFRRFLSITGQKPAATWSTLAIAAAIDAIALTGQSIKALTGGLKLYAQKHLAGGTRTSGAAHRMYTINDGLILPQSLSVEHRGDATLSYLATTIYDGTNDPVVIGDSVALPAGIVDDERFTLGKATIAGVSVGQLVSMNLDFGISAEGEGSDSDIWDTFISVTDVQPTLTLRLSDIELFKATNIPLIGKAGTHANTSFYLRKRAEGGTFVADGTAQHIKFTADGLAHMNEVFDASGNATGECELVMPLRYDGTNDPLTVDTTSAIA